MAVVLTEQNFDTEIKEEGKTVLVDFYADWCGPCKMMSPLVESLADKYSDKLKICKLNVDGAQEVARRYKVMSIPSFVFFKNGEEVHRLVGALQQSAFEQEIANVIG